MRSCLYSSLMRRYCFCILFLFYLQQKLDVQGFAKKIKLEVFLRTNKDVFRLNQSSSKFSLNDYSREYLVSSDNFSHNFGKTSCFLILSQD